MRVLLIQSFTPEGEAPIFPLGLAYLAAALPSHDLSMFDVNIADEPYRDIKERLVSFQPDVVGVSLRNIKVFIKKIARTGGHQSCLRPHQELISFIKKKAPHAPLIVGGTAFSLYASHIMKLIPEIDFGIFKEGEKSLPRLLEQGMKPENIPGLCYRKDNEVVFTGPAEWLDFASIAKPRRDLVGLASYLDEPTAIGVQTKRGCVLQCIHCSDQFLIGEALRLRPPEKIVEEIEDLVRNHGVKEFMFADQIFNVPLDHAMEICSGLIKNKVPVKWQAWLNPKYLSSEFVELARKSGCSKMIFSPDSASDKVLKRLKKGYTEKDLSNSYKLLKGNKIDVGYDFMINGPGESLGSIFKLFLFLFKAKLYLKGSLKLHRLFVVPMRIYPHSNLQKIAIAEGIILDADDLLEPVFYNPKPLRYISSFILIVLSLLGRLKRLNEKK